MHAGSDVVEAFTYYGHREKLRLIGKEDLLEPLNRDALAIAGRVARETGTLLAGDVCNTNLYLERRRRRGAPSARCSTSRSAWAAEAGVDFVIAETFQFGGEALLATRGDPGGRPRGGRHARDPPRAETREGWTPEEACRRLADAGAAVVGLNCIRGPQTMLPLLRAIRAAVDVPGRRAAGALPHARRRADVPVARRRRAPFPVALDPLHLHPLRRRGVRARRRSRSASRYLGLCCGAAPHHIRAMAEAMGRRPPASRYSPDMSKHAYLGSDPSLQAENLAFAERL